MRFVFNLGLTCSALCRTDAAALHFDSTLTRTHATYILITPTYFFVDATHASKLVHQRASAHLEAPGGAYLQHALPQPAGDVIWPHCQQRHRWRLLSPRSSSSGQRRRALWQHWRMHWRYGWGRCRRWRRRVDARCSGRLGVHHACRFATAEQQHKRRRGPRQQRPPRFSCISIASGGGVSASSCCSGRACTSSAIGTK